MGWKSRAERLLSFAAGRRSKWVVLAVWLVIAVLAGPAAAKLQGAQKNDPSSFLPSNAESTKVLELAKRFPGGNSAPAIVVYRRASGLTAADRARVAADRAAIANLHLKDASRPSPPQPSADGKATLYAVSIANGNDTQAIVDDVDAIRGALGPPPPGLQVEVTGPAAFSADAINIFQGIDTKLLYATAGIVALLLLITYRSPILWLIPLISVAVADQAASALAYELTRLGVVVNGQTAGVLRVLVYGAGTDYALLITARYREELVRHQDRHEAMRRAMGRAGPAIVASAGTVILSLLALLAAELNSTRGLGPIGAVGIAVALIAMLTLLPAFLTAVPRGVFWPYVPHYDPEAPERHGAWAKIGRRIAGRPRRVWIGTAIVLGAMALGLFQLSTSSSELSEFRGRVGSVVGQRLLAESYPQGLSAPAQVIAPADRVRAAIAAARRTPGVVSVSAPQTAGGLATFNAVLGGSPYGGAAYRTIDSLRADVRAAGGPEALVGGETAVNLDVSRTASRDMRVVVPIVLCVILIVLGLVLRAVTAPVMLVATVVLSFSASLGASVLVFRHLFGYQTMDPSLPLIAFIFLVALGTDYNIFLMARVREEAAVLGTRAGMLKGLAATGGVITSAGLVLAGTFSVLSVLPLVVLTQIGFIVAFGVLLDTLVVRLILVPALTLDLDDRVWWPGPRGAQDRSRTTAMPMPPEMQSVAKPSE